MHKIQHAIGLLKSLYDPVQRSFNEHAYSPNLEREKHFHFAAWWQIIDEIIISICDAKSAIWFCELFVFWYLFLGRSKHFFFMSDIGLCSNAMVLTVLVMFSHVAFSIFYWQLSELFHMTFKGSFVSICV